MTAGWLSLCVHRKTSLRRSSEPEEYLSESEEYLFMFHFDQKPIQCANIFLPIFTDIILDTIFSTFLKNNRISKANHHLQHYQTSKNRSKSYGANHKTKQQNEVIKSFSDVQNDDTNWSSWSKYQFLSHFQKFFGRQWWGIKSSVKVQIFFTAIHMPPTLQ